MIVVDARNVVVGERLVTQCTHVALCGQQGLVAVLIKTVPPQSVVVINAQLTDPSAAVSALPVYGELGQILQYVTGVALPHGCGHGAPSIGQHTPEVSYARAQTEHGNWPEPLPGSTPQIGMPVRQQDT
jgi:hypothetical protein